jgi:hypothetical protein
MIGGGIMKRSKRVAKRARPNKPKPKGDATITIAPLPDWVFLPNTHDHIAIDKLGSAPIGELPVDQLVRNDPILIRSLREALVEVYIRASTIRRLRKASKSQLRNANSAQLRLGQALKHLEDAASDGRDGLHMLLEGSRLDDKKGENEQNSFAAACWEIRLDIARSACALRSAINGETKKPIIQGERQKRLRTLVDGLADWWIAGGGKSIAPYVRANRRDDGPAVVHGRSGMFLTLALLLFCGVDAFRPSEVEAAVTNVQEGRRAKKGHLPNVRQSASRPSN